MNFFKLSTDDVGKFTGKDLAIFLIIHIPFCVAIAMLCLGISIFIGGIILHIFICATEYMWTLLTF